MKEHKVSLKVKQACPDTLKAFQNTFPFEHRAEPSCVYFRGTRNLQLSPNIHSQLYVFPCVLPERKITVHDIALVSVQRDTYPY